MTSVRLTLTATSDADAVTMVRSARRALTGPADVTVLSTGTGRHHRRIEVTHER